MWAEEICQSGGFGSVSLGLQCGLPLNADLETAFGGVLGSLLSLLRLWNLACSFTLAMLSAGLPGGILTRFKKGIRDSLLFSVITCLAAVHSSMYACDSIADVDV